MLRWMCGATKLDRISNEIIRTTTKVRESLGKKIEVARACDAKTGALCTKEGDGNGSTREEERKEEKRAEQSEG